MLLFKHRMYFGLSLVLGVTLTVSVANYLLLNLEAANLRNRVVDMQPLGLSSMAELGVYTLAEIGLLLCIASTLFLRKALQAA